MITNALILLILIVIVTAAVRLAYQSEQQHRELTQIIDALAEMIGEAIDQKKGD